MTQDNFFSGFPTKNFLVASILTILLFGASTFNSEFRFEPLEEVYDQAVTQVSSIVVHEADMFCPGMSQWLIVLLEIIAFGLLLTRRVDIAKIVVSSIGILLGIRCLIIAPIQYDILEVDVQSGRLWLMAYIVFSHFLFLFRSRY